MGSNWVAIAGFTDDVRCQIAMGRLAEEGIESVTVDQRDSVYKWIGEIQLCVHRDDVIRAKEIIKDL